MSSDFLKLSYINELYFYKHHAAPLKNLYQVKFFYSYVITYDKVQNGSMCLFYILVCMDGSSLNE